MEEVNLKQFLIEIGIRQEAAEMIGQAYSSPSDKAIFKAMTLSRMMERKCTAKEAVEEVWLVFWKVHTLRGEYAGPKPTQAYIDML